MSRNAPAAHPAWLSDRRAAWLLVLILGLASFLRLYRLDTIPRALWCDEAMNGCNALEVIETGRYQVFYPENNGREGLYVNAASVFIRLFGNSTLALRLPAALFGIVTVWGLYRLGAELHSPAVGLLSSFLLATSFWHLVFSRLAFRAIAAPCLLTWGLLLLLAGARRARAGEGYLGTTAAGGVLYGLGFHTYLAYRATPVLLAAIALRFYRVALRERWLGAYRRWLAALCTAALAAAAPLLAYFLRHPETFFGRAAQVAVTSAADPFRELAADAVKMSLMFFTRGDPNWRHNVAGRAELFWPVAILFALGIALAVRSLGRGAPDGSGEGRFPHALALAWMAVAATPALLSNEGMPHSLRAILMTPAVFLVAAVAAREVASRVAARLPARWALAGGAILLLTLAYEPYHTYFERWAPRPEVAAAFHQPLTGAAAEIEALPAGTPRVVVVAVGGPTVKGVSVYALPILYLTGTYTERQRVAHNVLYLSPLTHPLPASTVEEYCALVARRHPRAAVVCLRGPGRGGGLR